MVTTANRLADILTTVAAICALTLATLEFRDRWRSTRIRAQPVGTERTIRNWSELARDGHRIGPPTARLTVLEFGDFECPACYAFEHMLRIERQAHPAEITLVFRHWPLAYHRLAYPTARASECASDQGYFNQFHDTVYAHQDSLGILSNEEFARRSGVPDLRAFQRCMQNSQPVPRIEKDIAVARGLGSRGTPAIIINGRAFDYIPDTGRLEELLKSAGEARELP